MSIYQKLGKIQAEIKGLGQDSSGNGYRYVSGNKAINAIKPLMIKYGLLLKPEVLDIENQRIDYQVSLTKGQNGQWTGKPKSEILTKAKMRFTWIDIETGEKDECLFAANGQNDWEKGLGSALTYAERYFLLKYFHIATDEDDIDNPERKEQEMIEIKQKAIKMCRKYSTDKTDKELMGMDLESLKAYYNELKAAAEKGAQQK